MTAALATDAISVVVKSTSGPQLATEYMPGGRGAQIVNTAISGTVYAGTADSVSPSTGVPIEAGASVQWVWPGQLWLVPGPDVTSNVTVIISDRISLWNPSPETVATAVVDGLVESGIPNVIVVDTLAGSPFLVDKIDGAEVDVHGYASITLHQVDLPGSGPVKMIVSFNAQDGTPIGPQYCWESTPDFSILTPIQIPVAGYFLELVVDVGDPHATHQISVVGTNRPLNSNRIEGLGFSAQGFEATSDVEPFVANTSYELGINASPTPGSGQYFQGPAYVECAIIGSTTVKGAFYLQVGHEPMIIDITDTSENGWHTNAGSTNQSFGKLFPFPAVDYDLFFKCTTAGTATAIMRAIPFY